MSLYRKYRPKDFVSLIGQEHIKTTLLNSILAKKTAHAYLFTGPRGTGKTTTARLLAKAINTDQIGADGAFGDDELLAEIEAGKIIDIIEIDAASNRGIDEIRDLREKINFAPTRLKNKVYIIDEVHMLTKEAFNALLKTLEEPPSFVYFILATTEINKVPETIISRCQRFDFRRITIEDLVARLKVVAKEENVDAEEEALSLIAKQARGGLRDALSLMEQVIQNGKLLKINVEKVLGMAEFMVIEKLYDLLLKSDLQGSIAEISAIHQKGLDISNFNKDFLEYLREKMLEEIKNGNKEKLVWIIRAIENFQSAQEKQRFSYLAELPMEIATIRTILHEK